MVAILPSLPLKEEHKQKLRRSAHILRILYGDIERSDLLKQAEAMAYTTLFSLVPSLAVVFTLLSLFSPLLGEHGTVMAQLRTMILKNLAAGSGPQVIDYLSKFIANLDIKKIGVTSFAFLIGTLVLLLKQIEVSLNHIWLVQSTRNLISRFIYFWTFLTLGILVGAIVFGFMSAMHMDSLYSLLGMGFKETTVVADSWLGDFFTSLLAWFGAFIFFFLLYRVVPNCFVSVREASAGALVGSLLFHQGGRLYAYYVSHFAKYASIYGAVAAIPIFLFWLYLCWVIILFGALFAWRIQQGFPADDSVTAAISPPEQLRNLQVQSLLPLIALVVIYDHYRRGTGHGVGIKEMTRKLRLPVEWIRNAVECLRSFGYVLLTGPHAADGIGASIDNDELFPAFPAEKLSLNKLFPQYSKGLATWFAGWEHEYEVDFTLVLKNGFATYFDGKDISLAELLERVEIVETGMKKT